MSRKIFRLLSLLVLLASTVVAQDNIHIRTHSYGTYWADKLECRTSPLAYAYEARL